MSLKQTIVTICAAILAVFTTSEFCGAETEKVPQTVTLSSKVFSTYVGDTGVVYHDRPVLQSELNIALPKGFYANLWYSMSLAHAGQNTNDGNEFDPTLGWSGDVAGITLDAGLTYFDLRPVGTFGSGDIWQPYAEVSKEFPLNEAHDLTPYAKLEYGIPANGNSKQDKGLHLHSGLRHTWKVDRAFALKQQVDFVFDDNAYDYGRAWVFSHSLAASYAITGWLSLEAGGKLFVPLSAENDGRSTQLIGNAGVRVVF